MAQASCLRLLTLAPPAPPSCHSDPEARRGRISLFKKAFLFSVGAILLMLGAWRVTGQKQKLSSDAMDRIRLATRDQRPVAGLTHRFYRYPARFSPVFVRECIDTLSKPGDLILDPYMGGGTTVVESLSLGRRVIGTDINSLSVFVTRTKVSRLTAAEIKTIRNWATSVVPRLRCTHGETEPVADLRNMHLPRSRWLRKTIAQCNSAASEMLSTPASMRFARCVILNVGQWALNGRKQVTSATQFRQRVAEVASEMLQGAHDFEEAVALDGDREIRPVLRQLDAENIHLDTTISKAGPVDMVITSPPYPGIHVLYHRWQVDGRKETNAPYWISGCQDGRATSYYNFADRRSDSDEAYFEKAHRAFGSIRQVMRPNAIMVQLMAFSRPRQQLERYLLMLRESGFLELPFGSRRTWRNVPGRRWHANSKGFIPSAKEVLLVHRAD